MSLSKINDDSAIPKWQIALCVGGAVVVGAGIYYFLLKDEKKSKDTKKNTKKSSEEVVVEDVSEELEDDTKKTPLEKAQAIKNKGNKYFKGGKYEEAIKCYDEAINLCPAEKKMDLSTFYQNRAAAYEQLKNWENVMRDCTAALKLNVRYLKALQRRAKACEILKDLEQALEDLTAVCIMDQFQNQGTLAHIDKIIKELGFQKAKESMSNRKPSLPTKYFVKSYFDSFSEDPIFNSLNKEKESDVDETEMSENNKADNNGYLKAKQLLQNGKYAKIVSCCSNELSEKESTYAVEALLLRATFRFMQGEMGDALKDFDQLIEQRDIPQKMRTNALIKRGTLHMQSERPGACVEDFERAALQDADNADVFHHMGQVNLLMGDVNAALNNFDKAVKLNENFPIAVIQKCYTDFRYAQQLNDSNRLRDVMGKFEEMLSNFPKCIECYILYAQALCDQGEFEKADNLYERAHETDPDNPTVFVHRSLLLLQWKGDLSAARKLIEQALAIDECCQLAYENLATIEVQTGNLKRGVELFDKAIHLARTELEAAHLFSLRTAAEAQLKVVERLGLTIPNIGAL